MVLLSANQVSGSTPEGSEHYAQAHLLFSFEHESCLMPAPEQRVVNCPCGLLSMDLVDRIGHLSNALSRLRCRASTSCYTAD